MEIADIFVVNKADREGADRLVVVGRGESCRCRRYGRGEWRPPIVKTVATTGAGVAGAGRRRSSSSARTRAGAQARAGARAQRVPAARAAGAALHGARRAAGARRRRVRARSSIASPRARSIRTRAADAISLRRALLDRRPKPTESPRSIMKAVLDHVGIAVANLDDGAGVLPRRARPRGRGARGGRVAARARALRRRSGESTLELLEATAPDSPIAKYRREARARAAPHHAARRRHPRRARAAEGARRAADRRAAAAGRAKARSSRSSIRRARTACWSS